jgi:hypothetical protein
MTVVLTLFFNKTICEYKLSHIIFCGSSGLKKRLKFYLYLLRDLLGAFMPLSEPTFLFNSAFKNDSSD